MSYPTLPYPELPTIQDEPLPTMDECEAVAAPEIIEATPAQMALPSFNIVAARVVAAENRCRTATDGYIAQLKRYEESLAQRSAALAQDCPLETVPKAFVSREPTETPDSVGAPESGIARKSRYGHFITFLLESFLGPEKAAECSPKMAFGIVVWFIILCFCVVLNIIIV